MVEDQEEEGWEDTLVYVELDGMSGAQIFPPGSSHKVRAQMLGVASHRPILHINGQDFVGQYEDNVGTSILLEKQSQDRGAGGKPVSSAENYKFAHTVTKKLVMQPVFLLDKNAVEHQSFEISKENPDPAAYSPQSQQESRDPTDLGSKDENTSEHSERKQDIPGTPNSAIERNVSESSLDKLDTEHETSMDLSFTDKDD